MSEGNEPYPHKFSVSMTILQYIDTYQGLISNGEHLEDVSVSLAGS
jgi:lysyl-tRNA synthetase, class II